MIYYFTPFDIKGNLGKAYNDYCKLVPNDNDWICFVDRDIMIPYADYGYKLQQAADMYRNAGIITCITNRVGNKDQCYRGQYSEDSNIINHHNLAHQLWDRYQLKGAKTNKVISGHLFMFTKKTWKDVGGFPEEVSSRVKQKFNTNKNILAVDNRFSHRVLKSGRNIIILQGFYVFHYYRLHENRARISRSHLV